MGDAKQQVRDAIAASMCLPRHRSDDAMVACGQCLLHADVAVRSITSLDPRVIADALAWEWSDEWERTIAETPRHVLVVDLPKEADRA